MQAARPVAEAKTRRILPGTIDRWKAIQAELAHRMAVSPLRPLPRFVAGADAAFSADKRTVLAAAVVWDRKAQRVVEVRHARRPAEAPYVPGYLSFREGPAILEALGRLEHEYGAILFDGQGYAHPRRCGIATHLAVQLDRPGVGVGKSRLFGTHEEPEMAAGSTAPLMDGEEQIGLVLRTRRNVRPVFVSIAHRVDLESARALVLACSRYRVPEPTRQADIEVGRLKRGMACAS